MGSCRTFFSFFFDETLVFDLFFVPFSRKETFLNCNLSVRLLIKTSMVCLFWRFIVEDCLHSNTKGIAFSE